MLSQTTTHATLLARLSGGSDGIAWREFCDRYEELIRGFGRRQGLSPNDCDDILQDVLLALTKSMPNFTYDPTRGKFRSYLKTVTLHAIQRRWRQKSPEARLPDGSEPGLPGTDQSEQLWDAEWRQYHLRLAMKTIRAEFNPTDVAAFELYVGANRDAREAANELGVSIDSIYQAKSRILKRLGRLIALQTEEEG
ncbi:MAG: RNA polymerase sigma factor [Phycisphaerales bacterium]